MIHNSLALAAKFTICRSTSRSHFTLNCHFANTTQHFTTSGMFPIGPRMMTGARSRRLGVLRQQALTRLSAPVLPASLVRSESADPGPPPSVKIETSEPEVNVTTCPRPFMTLYFVRMITCRLPEEYLCMHKLCLRAVSQLECRCEADHDLCARHREQNQKMYDNAVRRHSNLYSLEIEDGGPHYNTDWYDLHHPRDPAKMLVSPSIWEFARETIEGLSTFDEFVNSHRTFPRCLWMPAPSYEDSEMMFLAASGIPHCALFPYCDVIHTIHHLRIINAQLKRCWMKQLKDYRALNCKGKF